MFGGFHTTCTMSVPLTRWLETFTFSGFPGNEWQSGFEVLLNLTHVDAENNKMMAHGFLI